MSKRYGKPGTMHGRFPHVKRERAHVVYVAEFTNGIVKVGYTGFARGRLSSCLTEARRLFGDIDLTAFHVTDTFRRRADALTAEASLLAYAKAVAAPAFNTKRNTEYFLGLDFADAVSALTVPA